MFLFVFTKCRYRGEGIIEEVPSKIIPFMYLPEYRNRWDKALKSYSLLESIDQVMQLSKIQFLTIFAWIAGTKTISLGMKKALHMKFILRWSELFLNLLLMWNGYETSLPFGFKYLLWNKKPRIKRMENIEVSKEQGETESQQNLGKVSIWAWFTQI